jgi:hypothetical protein
VDFSLESDAVDTNFTPVPTGGKAPSDFTVED